MAILVIAALMLAAMVWLLWLIYRISDTLDRTVDAADRRIDALKDQVIEGRHHTERSDVREQTDRDDIHRLQGQMAQRPRRRTDRMADALNQPRTDRNPRPRPPTKD